MTDLIVTQEDIARANDYLWAPEHPRGSLAEAFAQHRIKAALAMQERAAKVARCAFDDRPRRAGIDWNDGFDDGTKAAETAIRNLEVPE